MTVFNDSNKLYLRGLYVGFIGVSVFGVLSAAKGAVEEAQNWGAFYGFGAALCVIGVMMMLRSRQKEPLITLSEQGIKFAKDPKIWPWEQIETVERRAGALVFIYQGRTRQTQKIEADTLRPPVDDVLAKLAQNIPEKIK